MLLSNRISLIFDALEIRAEKIRLVSTTTEF
jgi:hypothetical protein